MTTNLRWAVRLLSDLWRVGEDRVPVLCDHALSSQLPQLVQPPEAADKAVRHATQLAAPRTACRDEHIRSNRGSEL